MRDRFDCLLGCAATASMQGAERIGAAVQPESERKRLKLSELRRQKVRQGTKTGAHSQAMGKRGTQLSALLPGTGGGVTSASVAMTT